MIKLFEWFFIWTLSTNILYSLQKLPHCKKYGDTFGSWKNVTLLDDKGWLSSHFINETYNEALNFSSIWIPTNCSYHRFTNESIHKSVQYTLKDMANKGKALTNDRLEITFVGDSVSRGIMCGMIRILSGGEIDVQNINVICGGTRGNSGRPLNHRNFGQFHSINFGEHLRLTFVYIRTFYYKHFDYILECAIRKKPYMVVVNTGTWDFAYNSRAHMNETAWTKGSEECSSKSDEAIVDLRTNNLTKFILTENSNFAEEFNVRIVYRNNHYNSRFGVMCADKKFETLLNGTRWEIWDNRRISEKVWKSQNWDGLHFDRSEFHTVAEHLINIKERQEKGLEYLGQLEMQLSQSILNSIFYDSLL